MNDRNRLQDGNPLSRRFVDTRGKPSASAYRKRVLRLFDLVTTAPGSKITLDGAAELALYADRPVDVRLDDSSEPFLGVVEFRAVGNIPAVNIRRRLSTDVGEVVIYSADPSLGLPLIRDWPQDHLSQVASNEPDSVTWAAAAGTLTTAVGLTGGGSYGQRLVAAGGAENYNVPEAAWLVSVEAFRHDAAGAARGTIDALEYIEAETGGSLPVIRLPNDTRTDRLVWKALGPPLRLSARGVFVFTGSAEVVDTFVDWWLTFIPT